MNAKGIWVILNKEAEPLFILLFFNKFFSVRLFCVVIRPSHCKLTNIHRMNAKGIWVILNKEAEPFFILLFFNKFVSVRLFCVVIRFFHPRHNGQ